MIPAIANSLWLGACVPEYRRFRRAAARVAQEQTTLLKSIVSANAATTFGRAHGFHSIRSPQDFQQQVPLRRFDDYQDWITRIAAGEDNVLTKERVRFFEPTSGSTGASKLVPYTATLQQEFRRGIQPWVADLFLHQPDLMNGAAYWSVSPVATRQRFTSGGIPIGFDSDAAYLGGWQQRLVDSVMAAPAALSHILDMDMVRYLTLLCLVSCRSLKLISVWNPTFLSLLMEYLPRWGDELAHDLKRGTISRGTSNIPLQLGPNPRRAQDLRAALQRNTAADRHAQLWPGLRLISCWRDANAAAPSAILQTLFPQATIQGKGLLSTEALVSFPMVGYNDAALAVRSHFFEFLPIDTSGETGSPLLPEEMSPDRPYEVVITTGGGLYRYRTGDLIEVTGHFHACPLIRFLGRHDHVSDWFGEKLNEVHVSRILSKVFADHEISPAFAMLACDTRSAPGYVLYIDTEAPDRILNLVAREVEDAFCGNFHYSYARRLGQLGPVRLFRAQHAAASYLENAIACNQRAGDIKPVALDRRDIWWKVFQGEFVAEEAAQPV